ncbi:flagellin [Opitutales bacterium]|nr:flagellin [Opitutales bacterium]
MTLQISTNTAANKASFYLAQSQKRLSQTLDRLSSGKRLTSPVQDPGSLAVAMKLEAAINRISGAVNNVNNGISFLEVQDGMLETAGRIVDRMSELKGLASQDPMKSEQDQASYDNEFRDLQMQLYDIANMKFNGVSLFANFTSDATGAVTSTEAIFNAGSQDLSRDNSLTIYTSSEGSGGSKVSVHRLLLLSALTVNQNTDIGNEWSSANNKAGTQEIGYTTEPLTFASQNLSDTLSLKQISVNVITKALENISYLRAQNGASGSRLYFSSDSLAKQKTNMRAALGRIVDADIAEETTNLAKYQVLSQAAASMLSQANSNTEIALMLIR